MTKKTRNSDSLTSEFHSGCKNVTEVAKNVCRTKNVTEVIKIVTEVTENMTEVTKNVTEITENLTEVTKNVTEVTKSSCIVLFCGLRFKFIWSCFQKVENRQREREIPVIFPKNIF